MYCATCILHWALHREEPWCPQCKQPFDTLLTYRTLDGQLQVRAPQSSARLATYRSAQPGLQSRAGRAAGSAPGKLCCTGGLRARAALRTRVALGVAAPLPWLPTLARVSEEVVCLPSALRPRAAPPLAGLPQRGVCVPAEARALV